MVCAAAGCGSVVCKAAEAGWAGTEAGGGVSACVFWAEAAAAGVWLPEDCGLQAHRVAAANRENAVVAFIGLLFKIKVEFA